MKNRLDWEKDICRMLYGTKQASRQLAQLTHFNRNRVLNKVAQEIWKQRHKIIQRNKLDLISAKKMDISPAMMDRLTLTEKRIAEMAEGVRQVAALEDPVGRVLAKWSRPNGLKISKVSVPIGVVLIIYEARPNVTVECASLCLKSGNVVILRGGREAFRTNQVLVDIFQAVLRKTNLNPSIVSFVETTDRKAVDFLLKRDSDIHLVIPRGGEALIRKVARTSRIPVIKHYKGICHVFVDRFANLKKAAAIAYNAKMHRTGVCNAMETLLVDKAIAQKFLPMIGDELQKGGCEVRGDENVCKILPWAIKAKSRDFGYEFLDKVLAVKVVAGIDEAIDHIARFGSSHTDAIVTENKNHAEKFKVLVDSASVMVNASTRFSDGFQFGFGAEIGISTDKIHARGPMGLEGLMSYKYLVEGNGQIRI